MDFDKILGALKRDFFFGLLFLSSSSPNSLSTSRIGKTPLTNLPSDSFATYSKSGRLDYTDGGNNSA